MNNEEKKNGGFYVQLPSLVILLLVGIISYKSGKKAGKEEYAEMVAKITTPIVE